MKLNYVDISGNRTFGLMWALFDLEYDHCILVSHPNDIFASKVVTKEDKDIIDIDWNNVKDYSEIDHFIFNQYIEKPNVDVTFVGGDYSGYRYIFNRLKSELAKSKDNNPRHLALTHIYHYGQRIEQVRAIFRATKDGIEVAINPEFIKKYAKEYPELEQFAGEKTEDFGV